MDGQVFALFPLMGCSLAPQRHLWPDVRIDCASTRSGTREFTTPEPRSRPRPIFISACWNDGKRDRGYDVQLLERERRWHLEQQIPSRTRRTRRYHIFAVSPLASRGRYDA